MRKKILATVLAASMALTMAPVLPVNTGAVASAEDVNETVGTEDKATPFWTVFSKPFQLESDKVLVVDLNNYGNSAEMWFNYVMVFTNDGTTPPAADAPAEHREYAVVRADDWGWCTAGNNISLSGDAITYSHDWADDASFKEINEDAHVTLEVARKGSWVQVSAEVVSNKDETKKYTRTATLNIAEGDVFLNFTVDNSYLKINSVETQDIDPDLVIEPGTSNPTPDDPTPDDPTPDDPTPDDPTPDDPTPAKKTMTVKVTAKKNATKVTGTVSVKSATVKVKVGKKAYKKATVNGKKFTIKVAKLAKGTKVTVKATKSGYKAVTKSVTVK